MEMPIESNQFVLSANFTINHIQKKAFTGFVASKLATQIGMEKSKADQLFFQSFQEDREKIDPILYVSEIFIESIQLGSEIDQTISKLKVDQSLKEAILDIHREMTDELSLLLNGERSLPSQEVNAKPKEGIKKEWEIYRDVIYAVTQKKFLLSSELEIMRYAQGETLYMGVVKERSDIPKCRKQIQAIFENMQISTKSMMNWLLAISEAITNIVKHADEGKVVLKYDEHHFYVVIEDNGPGFQLQDLPNMTLLAGYSTKKSMGQGFHLMLKMTEQIILSSNESGSTIILQFIKEEVAANGKAIAKANV